MEEQKNEKHILNTEKDFPSFCTWKSLRTTVAFTLTDSDIAFVDHKQRTQVFPHEFFRAIEIVHSYHNGDKFFALKFLFVPKHAPSFFTRSLTLGDFSYDDVVRLHSIYSLRLVALKEKNTTHA